jgi:hypothetical protein
MPMVYVRGDQIILVSPITLKTSLWKYIFVHNKYWLKTTITNNLILNMKLL